MANTSEARPKDTTNNWSDATRPPAICARCGGPKAAHVPLNFTDNQPHLICPTALWQDPLPKDAGGAAT